MKSTKSLFQQLHEANELVKQKQQEIDALTPKWISVEDRLPDKLGYYLVKVDERVASSRHYVTHWMPLPNPPKQQ